jgi:hypothetical protein
MSMAYQPIRGYNKPDRYPSTEHQLRNIFRNADENGLGDAFRRVGSRILVDEDHLQQLIAKTGDHQRKAA